MDGIDGDIKPLRKSLRPRAPTARAAASPVLSDEESIERPVGKKRKRKPLKPARRAPSALNLEKPPIWKTYKFALVRNENCIEKAVSQKKGRRKKKRLPPDTGKKYEEIRTVKVGSRFEFVFADIRRILIESKSLDAEGEIILRFIFDSGRFHFYSQEDDSVKDTWDLGDDGSQLISIGTLSELVNGIKCVKVISDNVNFVRFLGSFMKYVTELYRAMKKGDDSLFCQPVGGAEGKNTSAKAKSQPQVRKNGKKGMEEKSEANMKKLAFIGHLFNFVPIPDTHESEMSCEAAKKAVNDHLKGLTLEVPDTSDAVSIEDGIMSIDSPAHAHGTVTSPSGPSGSGRGKIIRVGSGVGRSPISASASTAPRPRAAKGVVIEAEDEYMDVMTRKRRGVSLKDAKKVTYKKYSQDVKDAFLARVTGGYNCRQALDLTQKECGVVVNWETARSWARGLTRVCNLEHIGRVNYPSDAKELFYSQLMAGKTCDEAVQAVREEHGAVIHPKTARRWSYRAKNGTTDGVK